MLMMGKKRVPWGEGWAWPVPDLVQVDGSRFPARVSQEFRGRGATTTHYGVDLMYMGPSGWFTPEDTPILAARAGTVWSTGHTARGWNVVIDHGPPFATFYQHIAKPPLVLAGMRVKAGDQLGIMGADPTDPQGLRHLHFAVWFKGHGDDASVDPASVMAGWQRVVWTP